MITTVTMNPAIDKIVEINEMALGKVHRVSGQVETLGGKSINVARILSGLKQETKALCLVGQDNYSVIKHHADADGITLEPVMAPGVTRTNLKITEPDQGYRTTDVNEAGLLVSAEKLAEIEAKITGLGDASDYMVFSGSLPKGVDEDFYKKMAVELAEKTKVIVDADGKILKLALEGKPFLIKPNIHEFEAALGKTFETDEDIVKTARDMIKTYGITYILISMGEDGSILVAEDFALKADILKVKVVSTVGAGDSMLAGLIYGMTKHGDLDEVARMTKALSYGVASSSIAISTQSHNVIEEADLVSTASEVTIKAL